MHTRSLSNYRSNAKSVASATVFFALSIFTINLPSVSAAEQQTLAERVKHLEELNQTRNQVQADISYQLSEIQREVRLLTGQVEDNSFKLKQIQDRQRDLYRDIENRLSGMASQSSNTDSVQNSSQQTQSTSSTSNSNVDVDRSVSKEFEVAFGLVRSKDFSGAITALDNFLTKHPTSAYSDNARYWLGQVHLVQGDLALAEIQFSSLISEFPKSTKRAAAQVKLGDIYSKQQQWEKAKAQFTAALNSSTETYQQLAKKGLDKIKQAGH